MDLYNLVIEPQWWVVKIKHPSLVECDKCIGHKDKQYKTSATHCIIVLSSCVIFFNVFIIYVSYFTSRSTDRFILGQTHSTDGETNSYGGDSLVMPYYLIPRSHLSISGSGATTKRASLPPVLVWSTCHLDRTHSG